MTRLRYVVDRERGPRGGHKDERHLYTSKSAARTMATERAGVVRDGTPVRAERPRGVVLEIDLDAMLPVDATTEDQFAWHERRMLHHNTEMLRLRPYVGLDSGAPHLSTSDMARIREAVSEWDAEEDRLRRGGGATPAAAGAFFLLRDFWREGKFG